MKVKIDESKCIDCGICEGICPEGFEVIGGKARVKNENASCVQQAAKSCPRGAIILMDEKEEKEETKTNLIQGYERGYGLGKGRGRRMGAGRRRGWGQRGKWRHRRSA